MSDPAPQTLEVISTEMPTAEIPLETPVPQTLEAPVPLPRETLAPKTLEAPIPTTLEASATQEVPTPQTLEAPVPQTLEAQAPIPAAPPSTPAANATPDYLNADFFAEIGAKKLGLKEKEYKTFLDKVAPLGGSGENYTSNMHRAVVKFVSKSQKKQNFFQKWFSKIFFLNHTETKTINVIIKALHYAVPEMIFFNMFGREVSLYEVVNPKIQDIWRKAGTEIQFGPECYKVSSGKLDILVMEDIAARDYKVADRLVGLDENHALLVLDKMARFHAATAVDFEKNGPINEDLDREFFNRQMEPMYEKFFENFNMFTDVVAALPDGEKYVERVMKLREAGFNYSYEKVKKENRRFVVLNHGDMWVNNMLFKYDASGKPDDVLLVDYQISCYMTPAYDLFYFLISSLELDIKVDKFDDFVLFYYEKLAEYLTELEYPKKVPTLKDLYNELHEFSIFAISNTMGLLAIVLLDPSKDASMDNFLGEGDESTKFKLGLYNNPRYVKQMEKIIPFLYKRGWMDLY